MKKTKKRSTVSKGVKKDVDTVKVFAEKEMKLARQEMKKVKKTLGGAVKKSKEEMKKVKKTVGNAAKKTQNYIKKNPKKVAAVSAGVLAAIGLAAGALMGRRKK